MILINNRNYLRLHHRSLLNELVEVESSIDRSNIVVEQSKKGVPTLKFIIDGKTQYVHSKYDPESEAKRLIAQLKDIETYDHILFVGTGLGYHIKQLTNEYPAMRFSIYEPNKELLYRYLAEQELEALPLVKLQKIFIHSEENMLRHEVQWLNQSLGNNVLIFVLPIYEKLYQKEITMLLELFKETLKDKKNSLTADVSFQERWTINAIKNFPQILRTPNILHDVDKCVFEGKTAIIVSAGPSLSEEFENLRYIKENGLAYIFSVGSAINSLIEEEIYPDGVCTYDPKPHNYRVIQIMKDKKIQNVPLIFGSSVGYETLENFSGPMLHMIINQDTVSPYYLKNKNNEKIKSVNDAPSIAIVTLQLLSLLGFKKIILVGQNLAYRDQIFYAPGIKYAAGSKPLSEDQLKDTFAIEDVYGNEVRTNDGLNLMRISMELYIEQLKEKQITVINTTKYGAKIKGTTFMELNKVVEEHLLTNTVIPNWFEAKNGYDRTHLFKQERLIKHQFKKLETIFEYLLEKLNDIDNLLQKQMVNRLEKEFVQFDRRFNKLKQNVFYQTFIEPMVRVQNKRLAEANNSIRFEKDIHKKGKMVVEMFGDFIIDCQRHIQTISPFYKEIQECLDKELKKSNIKNQAFCEEKKC